MRKTFYSLAALFAALVMVLGLTVGTASAEKTEPGWGPELAVSLTDCKVMVQANDIPYHVSSGKRTAGLAIRINGGEFVDYTPPKAMPDGPHTFNGSLSYGPVTDTDVIEFRWFAGPDRDDLPAWDATGPADGPAWDAVVAEIEGRMAADPDREHWDARDDAEFVNWYRFEVTGCPEPTKSPEVTKSPEPSATGTPEVTGTPGATGTPEVTEDPKAATLPKTSGIRTLPALLIGGIVLMGLGAGLYFVTRRKPTPTL